ncbi:MAG: hypothetical protein ABSG33_10580 [Candidatus Bathyarchaeia archaeon]|jgi:hypothetical protein
MSATSQMLFDLNIDSEANVLVEGTRLNGATNHFQRLTEMFKAREEKEIPNNIFFETQSTPTGTVKLQGLSIGVATKGDLMLPTLSDTLKFEITNTADTFIVHQKSAVKYKKEILLVAKRISSFLTARKIPADVCVDLFTDPEYSDWVEPKVEIRVSKDQVSETYDLFDELLTCAFSGITQKTLKRLSVTIDSR